MENKVLEQIAGIKEKVKSLKQRADRLEKENASLRDTVFAHLKTIEQQSEKLKALQTDHLAQELAHSKQGDTNLKKQLQQYITMIDECIANLKSK